MKRIVPESELAKYSDEEVWMHGMMVAAEHEDELWLHGPSDFDGAKLADFIFPSEKIDRMHELADCRY